MNGKELIEELKNFGAGDDFWHTPNTYGGNFKTPPVGSGIYAYIGYKNLFPMMSEPELLYIGSSKNLYQRHSCHNIRPLMDKEYKYIQFYFKELGENYRELEITLIKFFKPKYNLQHTRG